MGGARGSSSFSMASRFAKSFGSVGRGGIGWSVGLSRGDSSGDFDFAMFRRSSWCFVHARPVFMMRGKARVRKRPRIREVREIM